MSLNMIVVVVVVAADEPNLTNTMTCIQLEYLAKEPGLEYHDVGQNYSLNSPLDYLFQLIPFSGNCSGILLNRIVDNIKTKTDAAESVTVDWK